MSLLSSAGPAKALQGAALTPVSLPARRDQTQLPGQACRPQSQPGGLGSAQNPGTKPAPSAAPPPLLPGSGAGRPLLTAPFSQAYPASFPRQSPRTAQPRRPHHAARAVAAAAAVIAATPARSQETAARGAGPGSANRGGAGAGPDVRPATLRAPASPAPSWLMQPRALRARLCGTCSSAAAG